MERGKGDICPCAKCSPATRQSCCGCTEYSEWLRRNYAMKEDNARLAIYYVEDSDVKRNFSDWDQYSDFQSKYMYNKDMDMAMDTTNQLKDEYPCSNCSFSVRQNCLGCEKLSEWMETCIELSQDKQTKLKGDNDMKIDSLAHAEGYGSKELELIDSVNELICKYFDDNMADLAKSITESNQKHLSKNSTSKWHYVLPDADYPDPFTRVIVSVHENIGNTENVYNERWYTDIASYVGGDDRLWISNDNPVCGVVVAWMELPDPV